MAPPPAKQPAARKRTRKRKRRAAASSSESSSDSSSSDSDAPDQVVVRVPARTSKKAQPEPEKPAEESSSSDSDSESERDSDSDVEPARELSPQAAPQVQPRRPPSPTPPPSTIPPFAGSKEAGEQRREDEQVLKERFRRFWMASVADAFKDDLEEIRKVRATLLFLALYLKGSTQEPNMTKSRLAMLIESLAAGGDVFTSSRVDADQGAT